MRNETLDVRTKKAFWLLMIIKQSIDVLIAMAEALGINNKTKYDLSGSVSCSKDNP